MKLVKISPDKIQIRTDDAEFTNARLNDLISVSDGEVELVTMITAITDNDVETQMDDNALLEELQQPSLKVIECSILGSVVDGSFRQQIDHYPSTDAQIEKVCDSYFGSMLVDLKTKAGFKIGDYSSYDFPAYLDGNKFYQRHSCIVGNTGCGKSETVAKIIEETASNTNCNIVIFDIHGEYSQLSYVDSIKMGEIPFPIWAFGLSDMAVNILKIKEESATVAMSALRKAYRAQCPKGNEGKSTYFDFDKMLEYLKEQNNEIIYGEVYQSGAKKGERKETKGEWNGKLTGIVNSMEELRHNRRYGFLFETYGMTRLVSFINRIMSGNKSVKNIDLSGIPHDIAVLIIGAITKIIYEMKTIKNDASPMTLVCDEAHVYIPKDFQLSAAQRRMVEIFEIIAKEGRKFGITLMIASQRPSELNSTIFAQCENCIVMKLNNENDKTIVKQRVKGGDDIIDGTTMFSPGDCLVIGDACPIPLKIHVELAKERPQSKTIQFWDEWSKGRESVDYTACFEEYLEN